MGQMKSFSTGAAVHPVPLFASSWVALYRYLRQNFGRNRKRADTATDKQCPDRTGSDTRH